MADLVQAVAAEAGIVPGSQKAMCHDPGLKSSARVGQTGQAVMGRL